MSSKFKYDDKVLVTKGFYRGQTGKCSSYVPGHYGILYKWYPSHYYVKADNSNLEWVRVKEDELELAE